MHTRKTYHQRATDNGVGALQADQLVGDVDRGNTAGVGLHVAQVANVTLLVSGAAVSLALWVEVSTRRGAAVGVVAKLVNC